MRSVPTSPRESLKHSFEKSLSSSRKVLQLFRQSDHVLQSMSRKNDPITEIDQSFKNPLNESSDVSLKGHLIKNHQKH